MLTYFCIYSFLGYVMESVYISLFQKKWISSGLLKGPYIPLYGFGVIILIILSPLLKESYLLTFIIGSLAMSILEYCASLYIEKIFHRHCWDYSQHFLNLQGRICLIYSIIWGLLSILIIHYIHPYLSSFFSPNIITILCSLIIIAVMLKDTLQQKRIVDQ